MAEVIENISSEELDIYISEKRSDMVLVDVRNSDKFMKKRIKGAINIPYDNIIDEKYSLPRRKTIIVYCDRGGTSMLAAKYLVSKGYTVKNVVGGITNYRGKNIVQ